MKPQLNELKTEPTEAYRKMDMTDQQYIAKLEEELASLRQRVRELEACVDEHNSLCLSSCGARRNCEAWTDRGRTCPDCPMDYLIEKGDQQ